MSNNESSFRRLRLAVAFIAGMAITAGLAHTPIAADIFSPQTIEEPVIPAAPNTPGLPKPGDNMSEMAYSFGEAKVLC